jgi:predicted small lipoprotein YifL
MKSNMHNIKQAILTLLIASIFITFYGCGQTGALYLPQKQSPTATTNQEKQNTLPTRS